MAFSFGVYKCEHFNPLMRDMSSLRSKNFYDELIHTCEHSYLCIYIERQCLFYRKRFNYRNTSEKKYESKSIFSLFRLTIVLYRTEETLQNGTMTQVVLF